jgi:hypothetical protein
MIQGIYERLDWLTNKVKKLCCIVDYTNLPEYADNAAALAGGLTVGQVYRTGDFLKVVH